MSTGRGPDSLVSSTSSQPTNTNHDQAPGKKIENWDGRFLFRLGGKIPAFKNVLFEGAVSRDFYLYFSAQRTLQGPHINRLKRCRDFFSFHEEIRLQTFQSVAFGIGNVNTTHPTASNKQQNNKSTPNVNHTKT